ARLLPVGHLVRHHLHRLAGRDRRGRRGGLGRWRGRGGLSGFARRLGGLLIGRVPDRLDAAGRRELVRRLVAPDLGGQDYVVAPPGADVAPEDERRRLLPPESFLGDDV